jgi:hypothetical protein
MVERVGARGLSVKGVVEREACWIDDAGAFFDLAGAELHTALRARQPHRFCAGEASFDDLLLVTIELRGEAVRNDPKSLRHFEGAGLRRLGMTTGCGGRTCGRGQRRQKRRLRRCQACWRSRSSFEEQRTPTRRTHAKKSEFRIQNVNIQNSEVLDSVHIQLRALHGKPTGPAHDDRP